MLGCIGKGAVASVPVERVLRRRVVFGPPHSGSVDEVDVEATVAIGVEKAAARTDRFNDEFLAVSPVDVDEADARVLSGVVEVRVGVEGDGCEQEEQEKLEHLVGAVARESVGKNLGAANIVRKLRCPRRIEIQAYSRRFALGNGFCRRGVFGHHLSL